MGGQAVNGFLKATAVMQRMKKQRQRQVIKMGGPEAAAAKKRDLDSGHTSSGQDPQMNPEANQEAEEALKLEVMNARTAKKFKQDMDAGIEYCQFLHETIRQLIVEMDPSFPPPEPLASAGVPSAWLQLREQQRQGIPAPAVVAHGHMTNGVLEEPTATQQLASPPAMTANVPPVAKQTTKAAPTTSNGPSAASSGSESASTLRKSRRKKLPPSGEPMVPISEFDPSGKRLFSKKEYSFRISEFLRFRAMREGDLVAARLSSRDLWILARVEQNYATHQLSPMDFFQITEARRSQLFRDKVILKDVEDPGSNQAVARDLVLPLPRSYSEAAEWCSRLKKGYRVYAMYPKTTSLYSATVVDSTTYARGDDDIVVVEFDGDDPDPMTGIIPKCHIPARFVTWIPRDFAAANAKPTVGTTASATAVSKAGKKAAPARAGGVGVDDVAEAANMALSGDMNFDFDDDALPGLDFGDMDFTM